MIYFGGGGFTFDDLYNMPIYLRNFYIKSMVDAKKEEADEVKKMQTKQKRSTPNIPSKLRGRR